MNKILLIFGNIKSTKKADHILDYPRILLLKLDLHINATDFKTTFVLLLSCFVGILYLKPWVRTLTFFEFA